MGGRSSKDTGRGRDSDSGCFAAAMEAIVVTIEGEALRMQGKTATTAAQVLKIWPRGHFLCDSDGLCVGRRISDEHVVGAQEWLRPGQLYFVLPLQMMHCVFTFSDMAALLQRASAALRGTALHESKQGKRRRGSINKKKKNKIQPLLFLACEETNDLEHDSALPVSMPSYRRRRVGNKRNSRFWRCRLETIDEHL